MTLHDRIRDARLASGMTQTNLAARLKITRSAVSQWEKGPIAPDRKRLGDISSILGVSVSWLITGHEDAAESTVGDEGTVVPLLVKSVVQAGVWRESMELPQEQWTETFYPNTGKYSAADVIALRVEGNSMDLIYPDGSQVYAVAIENYLDPVVTGKRVIVQRTRHDLIEATCKELVVDNSGRQRLEARSTDPNHQKNCSHPKP